MKINLGCGPNKKPSYVNCDNDPFYKPDLLFDLNKPWPIDSNTVDEIRMESVVEHLNSGIEDWLKEAKRVLRPNGLLIIRCPNCFHWKARLRYLIGEFGSNSGFHYDHRWLFKPSYLRFFLERYGFAVNSTNDLFDSEIIINARKRL